MSPSPRYFRFRTHFILYAGFLTLISILTWFFNLDLYIGDLLYSQENRKWSFSDSTFWRSVYLFGVLPSLVLAVGSVITIFRSYLTPGRNLVRWKAWCVLLALSLGPGAIINGILKPQFGRPRPYQIERYDGKLEFQKLLKPGSSGESFPSGHASSGYALTILFYLFYLKRKKLAWYLWGFSIGLGLLLSMARIVQGGHFVSDTLWAFGLTQLVNCFVFFVVLKIPQKEREFRNTTPDFLPPSKLRVLVTQGVSIFLPPLFIFSFLMSIPLNYHENASSLISTDTVVVRTNFDDEKIIIIPTSRSSVSLDYLALAHGLPWSGFKPELRSQVIDGKTIVTISIEKSGLLSEYRGRFKIFLPTNIEVIDQIKTENGTIIRK